MVEANSLQRVLKAFGPQLLAYVCNLPLDEAPALALGGYPLNPAQQAVFEEAVPALLDMHQRACLQGNELRSINTAIEHNIRSVPFLLAMALERIPPVSTVFAWRFGFDPLASVTVFAYERAVLGPAGPSTISKEDVDTVMAWSQLISLRDDSKLALAKRCLLSVMSGRSDPVDGFIDAVTVWESLFGSGQGETTFRISMAMASLLGTSRDEALALQPSIAQQYERRNAVLRGAEDLSTGEALKERDEAIQLALRALRCLYRDHPALLADGERGSRLIPQA